ncbi:MAG: methyl-accepting chemotaxis protein [Candidatus Omnitrophica bacterium]|nr:methyl-accepting chemotaxis protein [Candidatus Omnitrophota bacterium]
MSSSYRRTHFVTDLSLQFKYFLVTLVLLLAFLGVSIWIVYVTGWSHLVERLSQVYPQGRLVEILRLIYFRLALGFLAFLPVAFLITLFLSHTVAGPLVRIKRYLRLMARGEFELAPLVLRRYDELKEVALLINEITSGLGPRFQERKKLIDSLQSTVGALRGDLQRLPSAGQEIHRKMNFLADTLKVLE